MDDQQLRRVVARWLLLRLRSRACPPHRGLIATSDRANFCARRFACGGRTAPA